MSAGFLELSSPGGRLQVGRGMRRPVAGTNLLRTLPGSYPSSAKAAWVRCGSRGEHLPGLAAGGPQVDPRRHVRRVGRATLGGTAIIGHHGSSCDCARCSMPAQHRRASLTS